MLLVEQDVLSVVVELFDIGDDAQLVENAHGVLDHHIARHDSLQTVQEEYGVDVNSEEIVDVVASELTHSSHMLADVAVRDEEFHGSANKLTFGAAGVDKLKKVGGGVFNDGEGLFVE